MKYDKFDRLSIVTGPAQDEPAYRINPRVRVICQLSVHRFPSSDSGNRTEHRRGVGLVESKCPFDTGFSYAKIDGRANRDWQLPIHLRDRFPFRATI